MRGKDREWASHGRCNRRKTKNHQFSITKSKTVSAPQQMCVSLLLLLFLCVRACVCLYVLCVTHNGSWWFTPHQISFSFFKQPYSRHSTYSALASPAHIYMYMRNLSECMYMYALSSLNCVWCLLTDSKCSVCCRLQHKTRPK